MTTITRTLSGRMIIKGLTDPDAIRMEYTRYASLLDKQLADPEADTSSFGGEVDVRFVVDGAKRSGWIWCRSQYAAAKIVYGDTDKKSRARISRLVYEGGRRDLRVNQWIVRRSSNPIPPAHRGWALLRKYVNIMRIYEYWARETYKPTAVGQKRRRDDFENANVVVTHYVGL